LFKNRHKTKNKVDDLKALEVNRTVFKLAARNGCGRCMSDKRRLELQQNVEVDAHLYQPPDEESLDRLVEAQLYRWSLVKLSIHRLGCVESVCVCEGSNVII